MDKFDGIFQADDIHLAISIDVIDHRGECRRFPSAGRTGHQNHALVMVAEFLYDRWHAKFVQRRYFVRKVSERRANTGFFVINIDPKPPAVFADIGEVYVVTLFEPIVLVFGQNFFDISFQFSVAKITKADWSQVAMQSEHRWYADREMDIGTALLQAEFQECIDSRHQQPPVEI